MNYLIVGEDATILFVVNYAAYARSKLNIYELLINVKSF